MSRISDIRDIVIITSLIINHFLINELTLIMILQKCKCNSYINYYYNLYIPLILIKSLL
jgi:hypothetical protein